MGKIEVGEDFFHLKGLRFFNISSPAKQGLPLVCHFHPGPDSGSPGLLVLTKKAKKYNFRITGVEANSRMTKGPTNDAWVAELVDARDLKSLGG